MKLQTQRQYEQTFLDLQELYRLEKDYNNKLQADLRKLVGEGRESAHDCWGEGASEVFDGFLDKLEEKLLEGE